MARRFKAAFDGGARGNPGPAAWGVAILDATGRLVEGHADAVGVATNNVAEYRGLLASLRLARDAGADEVELLSDSELVVKQMTGVYKVRNPTLATLWREARQLASGFTFFRIRHVRRAENKEADRLVNEAIDRYVAGEDATVREGGGTSP